MRIHYDSERDVLYIALRNVPPENNVDIEDGVSADLDAEGHVIGFEILDATRRLDPGDLGCVIVENLMMMPEAVHDPPELMAKKLKLSENTAPSRLDRAILSGFRAAQTIASLAEKLEKQMPTSPDELPSRMPFLEQEGLLRPVGSPGSATPLWVTTDYGRAVLNAATAVPRTASASS